MTTVAEAMRELDRLRRIGRMPLGYRPATLDGDAAFRELGRQRQLTAPEPQPPTLEERHRNALVAIRAYRDALTMIAGGGLTRGKAIERARLALERAEKAL